MRHLNDNQVVEKGSAPASGAVSRASRLTLTLDLSPPFSDFPRRGGSARGAPNSARGGRAPQISTAWFRLSTFFICLLSCWCAQASLTSTNDTLYTTWSDSFSRAQFGNRQNYFKMSYYGFMHPTNNWHFRDHSRSGSGNLEMLTNRIQQYGMPEAGLAATNGWNVWNDYYVSGNSPGGSNGIYGNFNPMVQNPWMTYDKSGNFTNDFPFVASKTNLFHTLITLDPPYYAFNGSPTVEQYNLGAIQVATQYGLPYIDSFHMLVIAETNWPGPTGIGYPANSNLWFNAPSYDHNGNEIQLAWVATWLTNQNEETNCFTAVMDWNSSTPSQTNHCVVSGISQSGGSFTFTFHADRMGFGYYTPDASQTNDCTGAYTGPFPLMPSLTNLFYEVLRITNLPAGNYDIAEDGVRILTASSQEITNGINLLWRVHSGALWNQKKEFLGEMCDMVGINRTNASDIFQPNGNQLIQKYETDARDRWPINAGMAAYIVQMLDDETLLTNKDAVVNANLQQTNHTFSMSLVAPRFAPYHR